MRATTERADVAYFELDEAARHMRVSIETLKRAIYAGQLLAKKTGKNGGGKYLIRSTDLDAWFDGLADA